MMTSIASILLIAAAVLPSMVMAFGGLAPPRLTFVARTTNARPSATTLFLKDDIAEMIDRELEREKNREKFNEEWMLKNRGAILSSMSFEDNNQHDKFVGRIDDDESRFRQRARDRIMAAKNPEKYCKDRCITTGNCDVFEEMFDLTPEEVMGFCYGCVANDECEIPDSYEDAMYHLSP